jgi:two-component system chemotaxis response regulator CheY
MMAAASPARPVLTLIMSDNADFREMYSLYLNTVGVSVAEARDGAEALTIAAQLSPDVIAADLGRANHVVDLCDGLRAQSHTSHIPLIAVTGYSTDSLRAEASAAGCATVIQLPCPPEALLATIYRVLRTPAH